MYRRVLVGTDGSEGADRATERAAWLVSRDGGQLHVAACLDGAFKPSLTAPGKPIDPFLRANEVLERVRVALPDLAPVTDTIDEPAARGLRTLAVRYGCDLLVVGNAGLGLRIGRITGSVARELMSRPPCDLLVVHSRDGRTPLAEIWAYRTVLVGIAGTETAGVALERAVQLSTRTGARLVVAHADVDPEASTQLLSQVATSLRHLEVEVETRVLVGDDPSEALGVLAHDLDADVTVVGSVGLDGGRRERWRAVASQLAPVVRGDLLVVRTTG